MKSLKLYTLKTEDGQYSDSTGKLRDAIPYWDLILNINTAYWVAEEINLAHGGHFKVVPVILMEDE